jgi:hypothetical protein
MRFPFEEIVWMVAAVTLTGERRYLPTSGDRYEF